MAGRTVDSLLDGRCDYFNNLIKIVKWLNTNVFVSLRLCRTSRSMRELEINLFVILLEALREFLASIHFIRREID